MNYSQFKKILTFLCIVAVASPIVSKAQAPPTYDRSRDDFPQYYFSYDYEYLDEDRSINIDSSTFNSIVRKYRFYPEGIKKYKDSLSVILVENYDGDWASARPAYNILGYSWLRLAYHLWVTPEKAIDIATKYGYSHPYLFKNYITSNQDSSVNSVLKALKNKIVLSIPDANLDELSNNQLLNFALKNNPQRIEDFNATIKERNSSK